MNSPGWRDKRLRASPKHDSPNTNEADKHNLCCNAYPKLHLTESLSFRNLLLQTEERRPTKISEAKKKNKKTSKQTKNKHKTMTLQHKRKFTCSEPADTCLAPPVPFPRPGIPAQKNQHCVTLFTSGSKSRSFHPLLHRNRSVNTNCCSTGKVHANSLKKNPARQCPRGRSAPAPISYCFGKGKGDAVRTTLWLHVTKTQREAPDGLWTGNNGCGLLAL